MASGSSPVVPKDTSGPPNVSVVLRVKRKREEDPLDALGIVEIQTQLNVREFQIPGFLCTFLDCMLLVWEVQRVPQM